jgi:K(+)-stimulated pyrophosphate-energized sodium pump
LTDFLTDHGVLVALLCAATAVIYGLYTTRWLLAKSPGNDRMQEISLAVQEGASAYLSRQYQIIGVIGVVIAIVLAVALDVRTAIGFVIGGTLSGATGFIGMNVSVRANARVARPRPAAVGPAHRYA